MEAYAELSSAGPLTAGKAQDIGASVLARIQRASFAGLLTVRPGELLTPGGGPVDLGLDHCGTIVRLILASFGAGGEVVPDPAVFMVGGYQWDEDGQVATVTPFQSLFTSVGGILGELQTVLGLRAQQGAALVVPQGARTARVRRRQGPA